MRHAPRCSNASRRAPAEPGKNGPQINAAVGAKVEEPPKSRPKYTGHVYNGSTLHASPRSGLSRLIPRLEKTVLNLGWDVRNHAFQQINDPILKLDVPMPSSLSQTLMARCGFGFSKR